MYFEQPSLLRSCMWSPAWSRQRSAADRSRLNAFLCRCKAASTTTIFFLLFNIIDFPGTGAVEMCSLHDEDGTLFEQYVDRVSASNFFRNVWQKNN